MHGRQSEICRGIRHSSRDALTKTSQKERERNILDFYLGKMNIQGSVSGQERPDFIVEADKTIGIEITEYHQPIHSGHQFSRTKVEAEWKKIREKIVKYRENLSDLDRLSVYLEFKHLSVPPSGKQLSFIRAVRTEIMAAQPTLTNKYLDIQIKDSHPPILLKYLRTIRVRRCNSYMEWDWNHDLAGVGTSENELLEILKGKVTLEKPPQMDEMHLVIAGDGISAGSYIGMLRVEWLQNWNKLNEALERSAYTKVVILNIENMCIWQRCMGWFSLDYAVK